MTRAALALFLLALAVPSQATRYVRFTPSRVGTLRGCCEPDSTAPLHDCYAAVLYAFGQQAAEWRASGVASVADPVRWARVVEQAAPVQVSSKAVCPPFVTRDSLPYPDSLAGRAGFVVTRNAAGGTCWSNVVVLP